ncbi:type VII secretion protein EssB [Salipaludibacillus sp. HK11]|uniref:type VII secretion protein EssB n=1 Tax=Salipaludibacillus sp. HK11 TaxID=3394320 RepID=UPI0039FC9ED0
MRTKTIEFNSLSLPFSIVEDEWELRLAKSQTRVKDPQQTLMLTGAPEESFVPLKVQEEGDAFTFSFHIDPNKKQWKDLESLHRNEKLRLLCNLLTLKKYLKSRVTFFIHPDNLLFNDNLQPQIIFRGVRNLIPPFEISEQDFVKQIKCFSIALFSKKFTFDKLYNGALEHATETEFQKQVRLQDNLEQLTDYLQEIYLKEQKKTEKDMKLVLKKRFYLFKRLAIGFIIATVILAVPVTYFGLVSLPNQQHLLDAHEAYLSSDYDGVISTLNGKDGDNLPRASKYILAYSYLSTERLPDSDKRVIMNNISLNSHADYLLYWIYNGRGDFEMAMDKAKYLDDVQLIIYGLIKQDEQARNDPELSGEERDELLNKLQAEIQQYREEYNLIEDEDGSMENQFDNGTESSEDDVPNVEDESSSNEESEVDENSDE